MKRFTIGIFIISIVQFACSQEWTPKLTEKWEPVPPVVTPGGGTAPPSDAIVLFDGTNLDNWESTDGSPVQWELKDGILTIIPGTPGIHTKGLYSDIQLHIEWRTPDDDNDKGQGRGNSGIYFQSKYEVQVLDSYQSETYVNGQAGSIYKQHIPLVNACRPPGEWQTYDIIFTAPRFKENGTLFSPATVTVLHNGVLIQNNVSLLGPSVFTGLPEYETHDLKMPLMLQNHTDKVSYRNIWLRKL